MPWSCAWREPVAEILSSTGEAGHYGHIVRLHLDGQEVLAKEVRPLELGAVAQQRQLEHERFLQGFQVEAAFYRNLSDELRHANLMVPRGPVGSGAWFKGLSEASWTWRKLQRAPTGS